MVLPDAGWVGKDLRVIWRTKPRVARAQDKGGRGRVKEDGWLWEGRLRGQGSPVPGRVQLLP